MNTTKKLTAMLLALVMALTLAACGGKGGGKSGNNGSKPDPNLDPNLGKYTGEEVLSSDNEWVPFESIYDLGSSYIELKEGGKGVFCMEDDAEDIEWTLDDDGKLVLTNYGTTCNGTLKDGLITLDDYFGFDLQMTFRKGGSLAATRTGLSLDEFADEYGGDWHGMAGLTDATGDLAELNDTAHEILARLVFDGNGGCEVWLAMYLEGENDFNFIDTRAYVVPEDDTGLELRGEFMGGEMQEGILSVDPTGALYVSCEVDSDLVDGSISLLANLRHLDDENWTDDDFMPLPADAMDFYRGMSFMEIAETFEIDMSLIPDDGSGNAYSTLSGSIDGFPENYPFERTTSNGAGEYGKSNPDATGLTDLATMQRVRQELWDMSSSKTKHLTYDDIKEMLGGEDGIPHTGMDEKSWNSEKHTYGWYNGEGDYYVPYFVLRDGDEYYTAATFSSSVRG